VPWSGAAAGGRLKNGGIIHPEKPELQIFDSTEYPAAAFFSEGRACIPGAGDDMCSARRKLAWD
jgi:hypothetical protein